MPDSSGAFRKNPRGPTRATLMGQRLLRQSERDLFCASLLLRPEAYYLAVSTAYQATEKALKAAHWHVRQEEPAWKHDLGGVVERVADRVGSIPRAVDDAVARLEPLWEPTRYPSGLVDDPIPADLFDEGDARAALAAAQEVLTWVRTLLP
jgi:HEPN domain-containing protein